MGCNRIPYTKGQHTWQRGGRQLGHNGRNTHEQRFNSRRYSGLVSTLGVGGSHSGVPVRQRPRLCLGNGTPRTNRLGRLRQCAQHQGAGTPAGSETQKWHCPTTAKQITLRHQLTPKPHLGVRPNRRDLKVKHRIANIRAKRDIV